jgi:hypothetical protein
LKKLLILNKLIVCRSSQGGSNPLALGTWDLGLSGRSAKLVGCASGNPASAVTHADNSDKNRFVLFTFVRSIFTFF